MEPMLRDPLGEPGQNPSLSIISTPKSSVALLGIAGMGVDLSNEYPTFCINQVVNDRNKSNPDRPKLDPITREKFLARTFNFTEVFLTQIKTPEGLEKVLELYHRYW